MSCVGQVLLPILFCLSLVLSSSYLTVLSPTPFDSIMVFPLESKSFCQLLGLPSLCTSHLQFPYLSCVFSPLPQTVWSVSSFYFPKSNVQSQFSLLPVPLHLLPPLAQLFMRSHDNLNAIFFHFYFPRPLVVHYNCLGPGTSVITDVTGQATGFSSSLVKVSWHSCNLKGAVVML